MNYKEFKASLDAKKAAKAATPQVMTMSAPSEARQRIEAFIASNNAKLEAKYNKA